MLCLHLQKSEQFQTKTDSLTLLHVFLNQIYESFQRSAIRDFSDKAEFKSNYLQPVLIILLTTFYPEFFPKLYPFRSNKGLCSKPLENLIQTLKKQGSIDENNGQITIQPTNPEERGRFARISNMEPKSFFDFIIGFSRKNKADLILLIGPQDPVYVLLNIYAVISISYAQVLHKKGIQTPALLLSHAKQEVIDFAMNWVKMVPELNGIIDDFIKPFFKNYWTCYHFLIDSYFPRTQFDI